MAPSTDGASVVSGVAAIAQLGGRDSMRARHSCHSYGPNLPSTVRRTVPHHT